MGPLLPPRDTWQNVNTYLAVISGEGWPEMLLNNLQCIILSSPQESSCPKVSGIESEKSCLVIFWLSHQTQEGFPHFFMEGFCPVTFSLSAPILPFLAKAVPSDPWPAFVEVDSSYLWSVKAGPDMGPMKMNLRTVFPPHHPCPGPDLL